MTSSTRQRPTVGFFDLTCCEGCQLTVVDALATAPELLEVLDFVEFREAMSDKAEHYDVAFIEGSCTRLSDESRLHDIRARSTLVVALGACADLGGINAIKNGLPEAEVGPVVYGDKAQLFESYPARPIRDIIKVDCTIPGCPITGEEFVNTVRHLLQGRIVVPPDYPVCIECKLRETPCVYGMGETCLGPITRAGCHAVCPSSGFHCVGCRGLTSNANTESLTQILREHGLGPDAIANSRSMFLSLAWPKDEPESPGHD